MPRVILKRPAYAEGVLFDSMKPVQWPSAVKLPRDAENLDKESGEQEQLDLSEEVEGENEPEPAPQKAKPATQKAKTTPQKAN
jgi:hypothetical protein